MPQCDMSDRPCVGWPKSPGAAGPCLNGHWVYQRRARITIDEAYVETALHCSAAGDAVLWMQSLRPCRLSDHRPQPAVTRAHPGVRRT
jgi:hypothetical protein